MLLWLVVSLLCLASNTGCGDRNVPATSSPTPPLSQPESSATPEPAITATLSVAAASDLKFAMDDLIHEFRQLIPQTEFKVTYGSSGNFFAKLSNNAPFDLFFSADIDYPRTLIEHGHALP